VAVSETEVKLRYLKRAVELRREIGDRQGELRSLNNIGSAYNWAARYESAIEVFDEARKVALDLRERRIEGVLLLNAGIAFDFLGKWNESTRRYQQALEIFREIGNRGLEGHALYALGLTYSNLGQLAKAIDYDQQALTLEREMKDRVSEGLTLTWEMYIAGSVSQRKRYAITKKGSKLLASSDAVMSRAKHC
jgi:tetratricopeptide (TPR) repeat protein